VARIAIVRRSYPRPHIFPTQRKCGFAAWSRERSAVGSPPVCWMLLVVRHQGLSRRIMSGKRKQNYVKPDGFGGVKAPPIVTGRQQLLRLFSTLLARYLRQISLCR